ncbi:blue copper protein 1a-like [Vitis vinifera]|uniref:blue copper protein 1a-like n=1 Tax=Vitis vinifera TaxID=29760 RepID=UPI00015CDA4E|nr:blue copper protein 1a-like [Vitis vinifera]|eukprot:XP_010647363.1 PREDICTED: stellacyanin-like [Vitis vinifera]
MASKHLAALAIFAIVLPAVAMATEFTVGDDQGWTINFDYVAWAKDKVFHVGDKLVFKYTAGRHNIFKVNDTAFTNCTIPPANEALTTGNDVITLATPGRKWYICGVNDHCANYGQKLAIIVLEAWVSPASAPSTLAASAPSTPAAPAPSTPAAPAPSTPTAPAPSSAYGISVSGYQLLMAAMVAVAFLLV